MHQALSSRVWKRTIEFVVLGALATAGFSCSDSTAPKVLDPPTGVTVVMATPTSARVTWTASAEADQVRSYNVFRNGTKVGEVTTTLFIDDGLVELAQYRYTVSANGISGIVSGISADSPSSIVTAPDVTPPRVMASTPAAGASGVSVSSTVTAVFSEPVDSTTVSASTFVVKVGGGAPLPGAVTYTSATRVAEFRPATSLPGGAAISVSISGVKDKAGNALAPTFTMSFTVADVSTQSPGDSADTTRPVILSSLPAPGATGVPVNTVIGINFSELMNPASVTQVTFQLTAAGGGPVAGTVTYDAATFRAFFAPLSPLQTSASYTFTATAAMTDTAGNALIPYTGTFTTAAAPDITPPAIISVSPQNGATEVATTSAITLTFSEPMSASTINASTFTVTPEGGPSIPGTISYDAGTMKATFSPSSPLSNSKTYTTVATSGMTDLAGNPIGQFSASFVTVAPPDISAPSIVAVTPTTGATGIAISTGVTVTFNRAMNAATLNSSTITLTPAGGAQVAATVSYNASTNVATLTPSAALSYSSLYTITVSTAVTGSNNVPLPATFSSSFTTVSAPDVTSPTVVLTTPANGSSGVAITSAITLTFSEPMNPSTINASTFTVTPQGGSPIAGSVSYDAQSLTATFSPSSPLLNSKTYTTSGSSGMTDLAGNALVAFNSTFATAAPPDVSAPSVVAVTPTSGSAAVPIATAITVTFNRAMTASSVNGSTLTLVPAGGSPIAATVSYNSTTNVATLTPSSALIYSTVYTINVTTGVLGSNGVPLPSPFSSMFTTTTAPDTTRPTVISVAPSNGASNIATNTAVSVTFSEAMNAATVSGSTLTVTPQGGSAIAGSVSYNSGTGTATFTPSSALANSTTYTIAASSGMTDLAGNTLVAFSSTFVTAPPPDITAPAVVSVSPANAATGVAVGTTVTVGFNRAMNAATLNGSTITLKPNGGAAVAATLSYNAGTSVVTLTPSSALSYSTTYVVTVTTGVQGTNGVALPSTFNSTFTTTTAPDTTRPTVLSVVPSNGSSSVATNTSVTLTFSEAMNAATVSGSTFTVTPQGGSPIAGTVSYNSGNATATFTPGSALANSTTYTIAATTGMTDIAGNTLVAFSSTFASAPPADVTAPTVVSVTPANGTTGVAISAAPSVTFSRAMNASSISSSTVTLTPNGGSAVAANVSFNAGTDVATLTPSSSLAYSTTYTVTVTTGVLGSNNVPLASTFTSTFTTGQAPDTTPPTVLSSVPANGSSSISTDATITLAFSEAMNAATVNSSSFTVTPQGGSPISGTISYNSGNATATFTPSASLQNSITYTIAATSGMTDVAGNALVTFSASFTTVPPPDITPPTVVSSNPVNGATGVAVSASVSAVFSRAMNAGTINTSTVTLAPNGGGAVAAVVSFNAGTNTVTLTPSAALAYSTTYTFTITTGVQGSNNVGMTSTFTSTFTTPPPPDTTPPTVVSTSPANGASNVAINSVVSVTFSEAMNAATVGSSSMALKVLSTSATVAGNFAYNAATKVVTFTPSSALAYSTGYTMIVSTAAQDLAGNAIAAAYSANFTTVAQPNNNPPVILGVSPPNGNTNVATTSPIINATFNVDLNASTVNTSTFTLTTGGQPVAGTVSYNTTTRQPLFTPSAALANSTTYTATLTTGIKDLNGNTLNSDYTWSFTTVAFGVIDLGGEPNFSGTDAPQEVHLHILFAQNGQNLTLGSCKPSECVLAPLNSAGQTIVGPNTPGQVWATIVSLTGTLVNGALNFTLTADNGRTFSFTGTATASNQFSGTFSGATQPPVALAMAR